LTSTKSIIPDHPEVTDAIVRGDVTSFSEPKRNRVAILLDEEPDLWYRQITHELTHICVRHHPSISDDLASRTALDRRRRCRVHDRCVWDTGNLGLLRDLVAADGVPNMTALTASADHQRSSHLGHAVF
jgi:hypothetical protein